MGTFLRMIHCPYCIIIPDEFNPRKRGMAFTLLGGRQKSRRRPLFI